MSLDPTFVFKQNPVDLTMGTIEYQGKIYRITVRHAEHHDTENLARIAFIILLQKQLPEKPTFIKAVVSKSHIEAFLKPNPSVAQRIEHSDLSSSSNTRSFADLLVSRFKSDAGKAVRVPNSPRKPVVNTPGIANIKAKHKEQLATFRDWVSKNQWSNFNHADSHYDWWTFPITWKATQHTECCLSQDEIDVLKNDKAFMKDYRESFQLVLRSWGWDPDKNKPNTNKKSGQVFTSNTTRIGKAAQSAKEFDEPELFNNLKNCIKHNRKDHQKTFDSWVVDHLKWDPASAQRQVAKDAPARSHVPASASTPVTKATSTNSNPEHVHLHETLTRPEKSKISYVNTDKDTLKISFSQFPELNLTIRKQNIFNSGANVIVNAANTHLGGGGGIDGDIHEEGGKAYADAHRSLKSRYHSNYLPGCATMIESGELKKKKRIDNVIVVAGPMGPETDPQKENELYSCYYNSLVVAKDRASIAFPSISTGIYEFPEDRAASIALKAVNDFYTNFPGTKLKNVSIHFLPGEPDSRLENYRKATLFIRGG